MKLFAALAPLCLIGSAACAQPAGSQPGPPPLVIVISVDQLSADLFDEYRPQFTGGFARLAAGTVFRNGYQSHATTETCLGHSTILTGDRPARTGIISNVWANFAAPRADKSVYCVEDERAPGTSSTRYKVSSVHLRVPTLGELLKRQDPASLNVAVAGKDRSAVMMGGHVVDQRWYWDGDKFATDQASARVPRSVSAINQTLPDTLAAGSPALVAPPLCAAKAQSFAIPGGGKPVGSGRLARAGGDLAGFRASPQFDGATLALSAALVRELALGRDANPDILSIGLSATDYVGHAYGSGGQEMCLQLLQLDRELGDFFARLDNWGLRYAVVLTADHGGLDIPERLRAKGVADAAWVDQSVTPRRIGEKVSAATGIAGPILVDVGVMGDIYLNPSLKGADRQRALNAAVAAYRAHPQVAAAYSKAQIAQVPLPGGDPTKWTTLERVRASFDAERSGDLYVVLKPHIQPIIDTSRYVSTHGSPWDYDRRVPILFWQSGMAAANRDESVETIDIMPTVAAMMGRPTLATGVDGHCLSISGVTCPTH
jgi:arylsulfatase A-like enzyme